MKSTLSVAIGLLSAVNSVYGHGYLTIPSSRTRLGSEVSYHADTEHQFFTTS
jgi:hypothetical protein